MDLLSSVSHSAKSSRAIHALALSRYCTGRGLVKQRGFFTVPMMNGKCLSLPSTLQHSYLHVAVLATDTFLALQRVRTHRPHIVKQGSLVCILHVLLTVAVDLVEVASKPLLRSLHVHECHFPDDGLVNNPVLLLKTMKPPPFPGLNSGKFGGNAKTLAFLSSRGPLMGTFMGKHLQHAVCCKCFRALQSLFMLIAAMIFPLSMAMVEMTDFDKPNFLHRSPFFTPALSSRWIADLVPMSITFRFFEVEAMSDMTENLGSDRRRLHAGRAKTKREETISF